MGIILALLSSRKKNVAYCNKERKNMKKIVLLSLIASNILFAETDKEKLFEQKYLKDKADLRSSINVDELHNNAKDVNLTSIDTQMKITSKDFNESYGSIKYYQSKQAQNIAQDITKLRKSEEFAREVSKNEDYILNDKGFDFGKYTGQYSERTKAMINDLKSNKHLLNTNKYLEPNEKVFIIISSSLKDTTITNYFKSLEQVNTDVSFVLRGVVGNNVRYMNPTREYLQNLMIKDPKGDLQNKTNYYEHKIEINPKITRRFKIDRVPAVLYIQNYNPAVQDYKEIIGEPDENENYVIAYGESEVAYALQEINKQAKSKGLDRLIKAMGSGSFYK